MFINLYDKFTCLKDKLTCHKACLPCHYVRQFNWAGMKAASDSGIWYNLCTAEKNIA